MPATAGTGQLPKGRHPLTREAVAASQRTRMIEAMAEAVAAKGYAATTVTDVVALARVSRSTFYEQFRDTEECFLATFEDGVDLLFRRIDDALEQVAESDWRARARIAIDAYLDTLAAMPAGTWAFTIEALGAGPAVRERRVAIMRRWVDRWQALARIAQRQDPSLSVASDERLLALVGGIEELVRERLCSGQAGSLRELAEPMAALAIETIDSR